MNRYFSGGSVWAITPGGYDSTKASYTSFAGHGDLINQAWAPGRDGGQGQGQALEIKNGVAVINIHGAITNEDSFFARFLGAAIIPDIKAELQAAVASEAVTSIMLSVESPGGSVSGIDGLAEYIRGIDKPVVAYSDGVMCSGAVWVCTAADKVIVSRTAMVGSIGVIAVFHDLSGMREADGIKTEVITAGKYKAVGHSEKPMTDEDRAVIQAELDYTYLLFKETVAKNLSVDIAAVDLMADGQVFVGEQAVAVGLVDKVGSIEDAFNEAGELSRGIAKEGKSMNLDELKSAHPELVEKLVQEGAASVDVSAAVAGEKDRIMALAGVQFDDGGKFLALVESGVSADQFKAIKEMSAPAVDPGADTDTEKAAMLAMISGAGAADPGAAGAGTGPVDFEAAWKGILKEQGGTLREAMSTAAGKYPDLYNKTAKGGE